MAHSLWIYMVRLLGKMYIFRMTNKQTKNIYTAIPSWDSHGITIKINILCPSLHPSF